MKKTLVLAGFLLGYWNAVAQAPRTAGTWVIESNIKTPKIQTIRFYNSDEELIYEEKYTSKKLRIRDKKVRAVLDQTLVHALRGQPVHGDKLLAANLKK